MDELKITKYKPWRLNFSYKGKHYSINEAGELYEEYVILTCKEDKDFYECIDCCPMAMLTLIPNKRHGLTYKQSDLSKIYEIIEKYVEPKEV